MERASQHEGRATGVRASKYKYQRFLCESLYDLAIKYRYPTHTHSHTHTQTRSTHTHTYTNVLLPMTKAPNLYAIGAASTALETYYNADQAIVP